jgi:DNA polymerase-3 subunit delta'
MTAITPKTNTALFGHEEAEAALIRDLEAGTLAHSWIISGPRGIGKATLAYRFARMLLSGQPPEDMHEDHPVLRRMVAGSHSDFLVLEQLYDAKKDENAREISVEQAREIGQFLSLTPGEAKWRVVIVDSADALNVNGANAILKILEEPPPQAILMLISHNPGRLLPTIRSRCRTLRLKPLAKEQFTSVMRHASSGIDSAELKMLGQLSSMSPGVALELHEKGAVETYSAIIHVLESMPQFNLLKLHAFAEKINTGQQHANWQLFSRLMLCLLERAALQAAGAGVEPVSEEEGAVLHTLAALHPAPVWAAKWQSASEQFSVAERLHLDYKQVIITFFHSILSRELLAASAVG